MLTDFFAGLRRNWGWFLALGVALIVLGVVSLSLPFWTTLASVVVFGWMLIFAGLFEAIALLQVRPSHVVASLLGSVLSVVTGALIVRHPGESAAPMTLLLAGFFIAGGIFRAVAAAAIRFPGWGWSVAGGVITVLLGLFVELSWPVSALWLIGTLVAVDIISRGFSWASLAFAARQLPADTDHEASAMRAAM